MSQAVVTPGVPHEHLWGHVTVIREGDLARRCTTCGAVLRLLIGHHEDPVRAVIEHWSGPKPA